MSHNCKYTELAASVAFKAVSSSVSFFVYRIGKWAFTMSCLTRAFKDGCRGTENLCGVNLLNAKEKARVSFNISVIFWSLKAVVNQAFLATVTLMTFPIQVRQVEIFYGHNDKTNLAKRA